MKNDPKKKKTHFIMVMLLWHDVLVAPNGDAANDDAIAT